MSEPKFDPIALRKKKKKTKESTVNVVVKEGKEDILDKFKGKIIIERKIYSYSDMLESLHKTKDEEKIVNDKISLPLVKYENQRTFISNFTIICGNLNRERNHVLIFFGMEIPAKMSITEGGALWIKGRYNEGNIVKVLKSYMHEFVTCRTCGSRTTHFIQSNGLMFILCEEKICESQRPIVKLKPK